MLPLYIITSKLVPLTKLHTRSFIQDSRIRIPTVQLCLLGILDILLPNPNPTRTYPRNLTLNRHLQMLQKPLRALRVNLENLVPMRTRTETPTRRHKTSLRPSILGIYFKLPSKGPMAKNQTKYPPTNLHHYSSKHKMRCHNLNNLWHRPHNKWILFTPRMPHRHQCYQRRQV